MTGALAFTCFLVAVVVVCAVGLLLFAWDVLHRTTPKVAPRPEPLFTADWDTGVHEEAPLDPAAFDAFERNVALKPAPLSGEVLDEHRCRFCGREMEFRAWGDDRDNPNIAPGPTLRDHIVYQGASVVTPEGTYTCPHCLVVPREALGMRTALPRKSVN